MGLLIDGQWYDQGYDTDSNNGEFVREMASSFIASYIRGRV